MNRRGFLHAATAGFALTPVASLLSGCGHRSNLPEGMVEIIWDRDTCARCSMVISDRRFAVEALGGPKGQHFKFDDIGCAVVWLNKQPWGGDASTRLWVADVTGMGDRWLDAHQAQYLGGRTSPMGYNFGAVAHPQPGSLAFEDVRQHVLAKG